MTRRIFHKLGATEVSDEHWRSVIAPLDPLEIDLLDIMRCHIIDSELTEWPDGTGRLRFARWLYQTGRLHDERTHS